ncbi:hypothetical protein [Acetobacterium sp.]|uniref:hypothetical protein n=1 Tax=Acetobacterium sp. TaxID=1872094 RepID=UPI0035936FA4
MDYDEIYQCGKSNPTEFDERFDIYKNYENRVMSNNDYYQLIVNIIFYSGFRAATVEKYMEEEMKKTHMLTRIVIKL